MGVKQCQDAKDEPSQNVESPSLVVAETLIKEHKAARRTNEGLHHNGEGGELETNSGGTVWPS